MVRSILVGSLALTAGCASEPKTISAEAYLEDYPSAYCALQERCYPERFADLFNGDVAACLEQAGAPVERAMDEGTCDFDGEKAAACVDWAEGLDCESWETDEDDTCAIRTICGD